MILRARTFAFASAVLALAFIATNSSIASASPVADRIDAATLFSVTIGDDNTARINLSGNSYTGSSSDKGASYSGKCIVKLLDRNGHRVLINRKVATGGTTFEIKSAKVKKGRIDVDARISCPKQTVVVRDDGDPYRVVFSPVHTELEGLDRFGGFRFSYFN